MTEAGESPELHNVAPSSDPWAQVDGRAAGALRGQQAGPYLLVERLGGGAAAAVYRAVDQRNGRQVALKVLLPNADQVIRERFRLEARTHSNLDHPNIVPIYDIGQTTDGALTYLAMELVKGPDLSAVVDENGQLTAVDAARLLAPIAEALDFASRAGVVHRDVKPSNVLLRIAAPDAVGAVRTDVIDKPIVPLLSDFGIARALDAPELTNVGRTIGTPTYMSPEQCADSHEIDGRSDLYSLGAVFYRCVVGRPPFSGTTTQILHAHVYEPVTIPADRLETLPPLAIEILRRALAKQPAHRYATGAAMAADLRRLGDAPGARRTEGDTATMTVVPSVRTQAPNVVLVDGLEGQPPRVSGQQPIDFRPMEPTGPKTLTPVSLPTTQRRPWLGVMLGTLLAAIVLVGGGILGVNLLPAELRGITSGGAAATATLAASPAIASSDPNATGTAAVLAQAATPVGSPVASLLSTPSPGVPAFTTTVTPASNAIVSPTVVPTPAGSIASFWAEARDAFAVRDWEVTVGNLELVRRINPTYQQAEADGMWFDSQMGRMAELITAGDLEKAAEHLRLALKVRPAEESVARIEQALAALMSPSTQNKTPARWTLATELLAYGQSLLDGEDPCAAAAQLRAASSVLPGRDAGESLTESESACTAARALVALNKEVENLTGRLLYSTQEGDVYRIYEAPARRDAASRWLVADGSQPARQARGPWLAFHSTRPGAVGIALKDLSAGTDPNVRERQLTTAPEDAQDAPPRWNPTNSRLVYGSSVTGDRQSRIYLIDANGQTGSESLGLGRDPAWHPTLDRIVYNGFGPTGGNPGLWLANADGSDPRQLTDNGNDIRPVWTPDGRTIVFMSNRSGNWDLYRVDAIGGEPVRLTDDPAQDGLPTVSPDGKWVAFASDRGGYWRIWVISSGGGDALPLITIEGVLVSWLEHAVQWNP